MRQPTRLDKELITCPDGLYFAAWQRCLPPHIIVQHEQDCWAATSFVGFSTSTGVGAAFAPVVTTALVLVGSTSSASSTLAMTWRQQGQQVGCM